MTQHLEPLLNPASIAFIGASDRKERIGGMPIDLLATFGYPGKVFPVNPKYSSVFGYPCFPDIESVPEAPDLAVLAIGAADVVPMLERCHQRGARAAIVYAAGFAEEGERGRQLQNGLEAFAASSGMIVAGPNCMGFANLNTQAHTAFASVFKALPMQQEAGTISLLTQSGNVCAALYALLRRRDLAVSHFINTGNEACVEFAEYLEYLAHDVNTDVVLGYIEQLRDGPRFISACRTLQEKNKMLIALKAGSTDKGAQAVQSHTSALAGDRRVYASVLDQLNVIQADDFAQMANLAALAKLRHRTAGRRVAVVTMSGALGAILADRFIEAGLELPDLPADIQAVLREGIPDYGMVGNPVDVTGNVVNNPEFVRNVFQALADSPSLDAIVVYAPGYLLDRMADSLIEVARASTRFIAAIDTGQAGCREKLNQAGVAVFDDIGQASKALGPFLLWQDRRAGHHPAPPAAATGDKAAEPKPRTETEAICRLQAAGVPVMTFAIATSADEARQAAVRLGFPAVLKVVSPDIAHKTETGGVVLGLQDANAVAMAFETMMKRVAERAPGARVDGAMVQAMEAAGVELIVGARRDPVFGPMITVGLGGVLTEIYQDVSHALLPVDAPQAEAMLRRLKAFPLLDGYRNAPKADLAAACDAIVAIGQALLDAGPDTREIEVNPLRVRPVGHGAVALDALFL